MFGKEPELYYKGKSKKTSWPGRIFTILFVTVYIAYLAYKLARMLRKIDVTFYDTFTYSEEPPKVKITNENFYGGFALEDPESYDVFIDESIYIPKAYFKRAERKGENFDWDVIELELERCKIEKFGSQYREKFKTKTLNNLYCFKNIDFYLEGHFSYDLYSFFYIQFFPCVNTSESQNCKPLEVIDYYLKNTFVSFQLQDIELTPNNYSYPVRPRDVDIYTTVGKKEFKEIHSYFQVVNIETDMDIFGFDEFENIKSEIYLKYDEMLSMSNIIESDIYKTGESFCDFTIKLSENIRTQRRTYTKLITILGDVGGLMEVVFTVFRVFCSFAVDILYDISLVNNLFSFDIDRKMILLKDRKIDKKISFLKNRESRINIPTKTIRKTISHKSIIMNDEVTIETKNRLNEEITKNKRLNNKEHILLTKNQGKRGSCRTKTDYFKINNCNSTKELKIVRKETNSKDSGQEDIKEIDINSEQEVKQKTEIINKIKMTRACIYLCFCCTRKRNIIQNILIDEGMSVISEQLDVFNIFDKLYRDEKIQEKLTKVKLIEMTEECKVRVKSIYNN